MKKIIIGLLFLTIIQTGYTQTITTFILVRHAEKAADGGSDPELKPEGIKRAEALAALLDKTDVTAIYSTNFKRTRNTVMPLSVKKNIGINNYAVMKKEALENLIRENAGGTIVIAGHSNTIPEIANVLVGENKFEQFSDDDYGNILIIAVTAVGKNAKLLWLRY